VKVEIVTRKDRTRAIEIGAPGSGVTFTDDPVEVRSETDGAFDHVLQSSATVRLMSRSLLSELFCPSCMDAVVNIRKNGEIVFAGYVEPQTYSQGFNEVFDEIEINCIDALSALQHMRYKGIGGAGRSYESVKAEAGNVTLLGIIAQAMSAFGGLDLSGESAPGVRFDGSRLMRAGGEPGDVFSGISVPELLFLGDSEDDVWQMRDVLEEAMRYLCLHIRQEGTRFDVFSRDTLKSGSNIQWHALHGAPSLVGGDKKIVDISRRNCADTDTKLSMGEVYNRISLTCDLMALENLVESPLDSDSFKSPYSNKQKYLTEYISEGDGKTAYRAFVDITGGNVTDYTEAKVRDWFMQVQDAMSWRFFGDGGKDLMSLYCRQNPNRDQHALPFAMREKPGASLMAFGVVDRNVGTSDNSLVSKVDMTTSLVVSVNGNGKDTPGEAYPTEASLLANSPCAEYVGNTSGGVFSPSDDDTTNYIVLSGKIALNPLVAVSCRYDERPGNNPDPVWWPLHYFPVASKNNTQGRYYTQQWWKADSPTSPPQEESAVEGLLPMVGGSPDEYEFAFSAIGDGTDTVSKVGVLACMLVIGDKCVVETGTQGRPSDFQWREYKPREECADDDEYYAQCFTIGFDPKIGDKLIGPEYDIQNNIDYTMGIDAEGTAIPVKKSDRLSGKVRFMVLGPVNTIWGDITRRHPTWFRHTKWTEKSVPLMAHVSSIFVNEFEIKVHSDNGLVNNTEDCNLVYVSDSGEEFVNEKDDITFRFTSALTSAERQTLGLADSVNISTPRDEATGLGLLSIFNAVTQEEGKPEQIYVDSYYKECHRPRVELTQSLFDTADNVGFFNHYRHPALPDKEFFVTGISRRMIEGDASINLKEI